MHIVCSAVAHAHAEKTPVGQISEAEDLISKTTTFHVHHAFSCIFFAIDARLQRESTNFTSGYAGRER